MANFIDDMLTELNSDFDELLEQAKKLKKNRYKVVNVTKDHGLDVISNGNDYYVLYGWNGENYGHCWHCKDKYGYYDEDFDKEEYTITPVQQVSADLEQYETIDYDIE